MDFYQGVMKPHSTVTVIPFLFPVFQVILQVIKMLMDGMRIYADRGLGGAKISGPAPHLSEHLLVKFAKKAHIKYDFFNRGGVERVLDVGLEYIVRFGIVQVTAAGDFFEF